MLLDTLVNLLPVAWHIAHSRGSDLRHQFHNTLRIGYYHHLDSGSKTVVDPELLKDMAQREEVDRDIVISQRREEILVTLHLCEDHVMGDLHPLWRARSA